MRFSIFPVLALTLYSSSALASNVNSQVSLQNSAQAGFEYDSNVFKTFGASQGDVLTRLLFKSRGFWLFDPEWKLEWDYQGGGKIYFDKHEKDALIQYIEAPLSWRPHNRFELRFSPEFKYQNERNKTDAAGLGINEDYYSATAKLSARWSLPKNVAVESFAGFTYFNFAPAQNFSFFQEWGGVAAQRTLSNLVAIGSQYSYSRQQFRASFREDREHQISAFIQYLRVPIVSTRYTYQDNNSSDPTLSFQNHRISLLISIPFGSREDPKQTADDEEKFESLFALHILGTLHLKNFPSVFNYTAEGTRYLLTGAEDENFNSILVKLSYHPFQHVAFEGKYTRYSNELSTQQSSFSRSLYYGGVRIDF